MAFCEFCGKEVSDQAVTCPNCGHPRGPVAQPVIGGAPITASGQQLAEWWKRLVAILIDGVILAIPANIFAVIFFSPVSSGTAGETAFYGSYLGFLVMSAVFGFLYYAALNGSDRGQTVGKMALKIQVRDVNTGGPIGFGRGAVRTLIPAVISPFTCGVLGLLDGLWPLWDQQRQALHDKMAQSIVVDVPR